VVKFCVEALEEGETPILLGYVLGKSQEILSALGAANLPIVLHASVARIARIYEEFGVVFPPYSEFAEQSTAGGVLICPPSANGSRMLRAIRRRRVAALTGWAMDPGAIFRLGVDAAFPISDHADYIDLLRYVETVRPARVLTVHVFAREFARDLRARGIEAWALTGENQLEFLISPKCRRNGSRCKARGPREEKGFNRFCQVCEAVRKSTGKLEKVRILARYLRSLDEEELPLAAVWLTGRAFPQRDPSPLNLGGAVIWRALRPASGLSEIELRAISRKYNDSGMSAAEAMLARPGSCDLAMTEIGAAIDRLRAMRGPVLKDLSKSSPEFSRGIVIWFAS
jgi:DNA ligase-1